MSGPRRTSSSEKKAIREDVFMPIAGASSQPVGVAELVRRLGEAEAKLRDSENDRAADAELIGNLLAGIADRDRRLKALEASVESLRAEQAAVVHPVPDDERERGLEQSLRRTDAVFAELLRRLAEQHGGEPELSGLHDLLAVTLGALDLTRSTATEDARKLDDAATAMAASGQREVARALGVTLARTHEVLAGVLPVDRALGQIIERLREVEQRQRELAELRDAVLADGSELLADVRQLRDAVGVLATMPSAPRRKPSRPPPRRA